MDDDGLEAHVAAAICADMNAKYGTGQFYDCARIARVAIAAILANQEQTRKANTPLILP